MMDTPSRVGIIMNMRLMMYASIIKVV
jgi:hypothetical protein